LNAALAPLAPAPLAATLSAPVVEAVAPDSFSLSTTPVPPLAGTALVVAAYHATSLLCTGGIHVQASPFSAALSTAAQAMGSGHVKRLLSREEDESVRMGTLDSEHKDGGSTPVSKFMLSALQPSGRGRHGGCQHQSKLTRCVGCQAHDSLAGVSKQTKGQQGTHSACRAVKEPMLDGRLPVNWLPAAFLHGRQARVAV
jgi:hypothetical protein